MRPDHEKEAQRWLRQAERDLKVSQCAARRDSF